MGSGNRMAEEGSERRPWAGKETQMTGVRVDLDRRRIARRVRRREDISTRIRQSGIRIQPEINQGLGGGKLVRECLGDSGRRTGEMRSASGQANCLSDSVV